MRWALLLLLFIAPYGMPFADATTPASSRQGELFAVVAPMEVVVHPNETVSTYITVHNKAGENQALTITPLSVPSVVEVLGLPLTELLVPNHLRQMVFNIKANASASYQNVTVSFMVSTDLDGTVNQTVEMNIVIAQWSNLNFGVDDFATLTVDEKIRTAVAVNISNNGSYADNVTFSLYSASGWSWGWNMPYTSGETSYSIINPGQLIYVYFWVDIPAVENGAPLVETGPRFVLSAVSGLDKRSTQWSVDLLMNEKKNASIDDVQTELVVAPNQDGRLSAVVRNVGNSPNTLNITLQALDEDGEPAENSPPADRFNSSGWVVALFGGLEDVTLQPNESRTIEIGFQSPNEFSGELSVRLYVFPSGGAAEVKTADVMARIERVASAELTYSQEGCQSILPNQTCEASLTVINTGNAYDTYVLRLGEITDGFDVVIPGEGLLVQANQAKSFAFLQIQADANTVAFLLGNATIEVLGDTGEVMAAVTIPLKVAPEIKWTFRNVEEQVNARGRMTFAMEVRNEGNAVDGLIVQLQSSHVVDMGFIPPEQAVFEEGVEFPRSFEINEIPLNSNFTIRAWVQLPMDQANNGTVYINTTIRSRLAPETPFVYTSTGDYLGKQWQPQEVVDEGVDWGGLASTAVLYLKAWSGVLFAILVAGVIIYKAVIDRERRLETEHVLPYQEQSSADDWLQQYRKEPEPEMPEPVQAPLEPVPRETYEAMFRHTHGEASVPNTPVETTLVEAANLVIDKRTEDISRTKADELLASIQPEYMKLDAARAATLQSETPPLVQDLNKDTPLHAADDDLEF